MMHLPHATQVIILNYALDLHYVSRTKANKSILLSAIQRNICKRYLGGYRVAVYTYVVVCEKSAAPQRTYVAYFCKLCGNYETFRPYQHGSAKVLCACL